MLDRFNENLKFKNALSNYYIIPNSIGAGFENKTYNSHNIKKYDFVTIRTNLDGSKYCIDLVYKLASLKPNLKFLVIGKGEFFKRHAKLGNIYWIDQHLTHEDILNYLNESKCALMLSRFDSQGLMSCEIASTGMPLITSDLKIFRDVFQGFPNVGFIDNEFEDADDLDSLLDNLIKGNPYPINNKFGPQNTIQLEIELFRKILKKQCV